MQQPDNSLRDTWATDVSYFSTTTILEGSEGTEKLSQELSKRDASQCSSIKISDAEKGMATGEDGKTGETVWVDWNGPDDLENPKNWSHRKKWATAFVVSAFNFISPASSSMIAPASGQIANEFGITSTVVISMVTSAFVLGYAVGPLLIGPMSEVYGRSRVLKLSNLFYLVWNIACGFSQNSTQILLFRFLAGIGGSAPLSVGGAVLGDIFHPEQRGKALAMYSLVSMLGPVVGPVCAGWITQRSTWRWVFWSISLFDVLIQISGFFLLHETYPILLLDRKARGLRNKDADSGDSQHFRTIYDKGESRKLKDVLSRALTRPFQLFIREPIIQLFGTYMAFVYGIFYLYLTRMPAIFSDVYQEAPDIAGLQYIALGLGLSFASQINALCVDQIYSSLKRKNGNVGEPEFRLPPMFPGTVLLPLGLLITGWAAQKELHWALTDGIACVGTGMILNFQSMQIYVIDAFTLHSASALAAVSCLRSFAGFGFPLFGPAMYKQLGYGMGDTLLAAFAFAIGCPAPWLLWKFGRRIRMQSKYAH